MLKEKAIRGLTIALFVGGVIFGGARSASEPIREETNQVPDSAAFYVAIVEMKDDGRTVINFNDGSWAVIDVENSEYIFQPWMMGDYEYAFTQEDDGEWATIRFINCMRTYAELEHGVETSGILDAAGNDITAEFIEASEYDRYVEHMQMIENM